MGEGKEKRAKNRNPPLILVNFNFILNPKQLLGKDMNHFVRLTPKIESITFIILVSNYVSFHSKNVAIHYKTARETNLDLRKFDLMRKAC